MNNTQISCPSCLFMYFFIHGDSSSIISLCFSVPNVPLLCVLKWLAEAANVVNLLVALTPVKAQSALLWDSNFV